jgi:hypothetical protein
MTPAWRNGNVVSTRRVAVRVRVVEVVDRRIAVEEDRLLHAAHGERARVEVVILLRAAD